MTMRYFAAAGFAGDRGQDIMRRFEVHKKKSRVHQSRAAL
jgi:hypothetical protein